MEALIRDYISDHQNAWETSTQASEAARLRGVLPYLTQLDFPAEIYAQVCTKYKPYALSTLFIRLTHFYSWLIETGHRSGPNPYTAWRRRNAKIFKTAYKREKLEVSFEGAKKQIAKIQDQVVQRDALELLRTGLRISETQKIVGDKVCGKGSKFRTIFTTHSFKSDPRRIRRELKKVGLKPHSLRKLFASRLVEKGARPEDLCEIMGWSSIKTAYHYLQPRKEEELLKLVKEIR